MVMGCFVLSGVRPPHRIHGNMDTSVYKHIMENVMLTFAHKKNIQEMDVPARLRSYVYFESRQEFQVKKKISQSLGWNSIEHLLDDFQRAIEDINVKNADENLDVLSEAWNRISHSKIENLIESMPRICKDVIGCLSYPRKYWLVFVKIVVY